MDSNMHAYTHPVFFIKHTTHITQESQGEGGGERGRERKAEFSGWDIHFPLLFLGSLQKQ